MSDFLVLADVDKIQEYVFSSGRLRAIRGSSLVIVDLDHRIRDLITQLGGDCYRYVGGQIIGKLQQDKLGLFHEKTQRICNELWGAALSITTTDVELVGSFAQAMEAGFDKLHEKKTNRFYQPMAEPRVSGGFIRHCDLCATYPSQPDPDQPDRPTFTLPDGEQWYLCESCWKRMNEQRVDRDAEAFKKALGDSWPVAKPLHFLSDSERMWRDGSQGHYMALLVADGAAIGRVVETIDDAGLYRAFSLQFKQLIINSLAQAVQKCKLLGSYGPRVVPIVSGGDDLSVLLPAENAPQFTQALVDAFHKGSRNSEAIQKAIAVFRTKFPNDPLFPPLPDDSTGWSLRLGMGLVVSKPNYPISAYYHLAHQLRSSARAKHPYTSAIDFSYITSSLSEELSKARQPYNRSHPHYRMVNLTNRPYTSKDFASLMGLQAVLDQLPRSKQKWFAQEIWQGIEAGEKAYKFLCRREGKAFQDQFKNALSVLGTVRSGLNIFIETPGGLETPVLDAIELSGLAENG